MGFKARELKWGGQNWMGQGQGFGGRRGFGMQDRSYNTKGGEMKARQPWSQGTSHHLLGTGYLGPLLFPLRAFRAVRTMK